MFLQHLQTFCRVVEERSFTRAAEALHLSQPTVTKQVRSLEQELGTILLHRDHREVTLTPAGELVYLYAQRVLNLVRELHSALEALNTPGRGDLRLAAVLTITLFTLPRILDEYSHRHPLVTLHVQTGTNQEVLAKVLRNEADVGLVTVPMTHGQVRTIPLFDDRIVLVASPGTPWAQRLRIAPAELAQLPMITYQRHSHFRNFVDANFEAAGITPNVVMEFDSHEAVKVMALLGLGVAMLPASAIAEDLARGALVEIKIEGFPELSRTTSALVRRDRPATPPLAHFLALLEEMYGRRQPER